MVLVLLILAGVAWAIISLGVVPSPFSRVLVRIYRGEARVEKGDLKTRAREHLADVIREAQIEEGFITISQSRSITFSLGFPERLRRTLRNILLN